MRPHVGGSPGTHMPEWCPWSTDSSSTRAAAGSTVPPLAGPVPRPPRAFTGWRRAAPSRVPPRAREERGGGRPPPGYRPELARGGEEGVLVGVDGRLVPGVRGGLQLERSVVQVEVVTQALAERVEHASAVPRSQRLVGDDHVRGEDGRPRGDGPRVQVVHAQDAIHPEYVRPDLGEVAAPGSGLEQDVERLS